MSPLIDSVALDYLETHPGESARVIESLPAGEVATTLQALPSSARGQVLGRMNAQSVSEALAAFDSSTATETLLETSSVRAARWLALLHEPLRDALLHSLPEQAQKEIREALSYPPGTAGSLMDPGVIYFHPEASIGGVLEVLRGVKNRRITDLVVCDGDTFEGVVPLQELLGAEDDARLSELVQRDIPVVQPMTSRDEVVNLLETHRLASLPVIDFERRILGIIRYDGLVRAAQQAATTDLQKMVGAGAEERALASPWQTTKSRLPWLLLNLLTAFAAAAVVGIFDETIARFTALAVLLPLVAGQSGNTGAQALAVTSRGLALREIRLVHWFRVVRKEVVAAGMNSVAVSVVTCAAVLLWSGSVGLAAVIGISMIVSMVVAAIAGAIIPILLTSAGRDPATASSIILTTVTDISGFFSFLGLATAMQGLLSAG